MSLYLYETEKICTFRTNFRGYNQKNITDRLFRPFYQQICIYQTHRKSAKARVKVDSGVNDPIVYFTRPILHAVARQSGRQT